MQRNHKSNCQHLLDHQKSKRIPEYLYFWFIDYTKAFDCMDHIQTMEIFLKRWEYQITLPVSWETCVQDKKQQLELDMEQQTGSKLGKEYTSRLYIVMLLI